MVNNIIFCYDAEKHTGNGNKRKQYFLQHKENHSNNKEVYTDGSKSTRRKVGFAAVFADIIRRSIHPHSNKKSNERDTKKRGYEIDNIYRLGEFNTRHCEQQKKPSNIK